MSVNDPTLFRASPFPRAERDLYETIDTRVHEALVKALPKVGVHPGATIWEPACASGLLVEPMRTAGYTVHGSDLEPLKDEFTQSDFLTGDLPFGSVDAIMTNPPFSTMAAKFADQCVAHLRSGAAKVAILFLRFEYDSAGPSRHHLFRDCPEFSHKITLTFRPHWVFTSNSSPRHNYAFYIWTACNNVAPTMLWM